MALVLDPLQTMPGDTEYYVAVAKSLVETGEYAFNGQATTYRTPGYPLFLAAVFVLSSSPLIVFVVQSLLTAAAAIVTLYRLPKYGFATALLIVTSPFLIVHEWKVLSEGLFIPVLWIGFVLLLYPRTKADPFLGGAAIGFAILTRDSLLLLPICMIFLALLHRPLLKRTLVAALAAYLVVLPWPIRNATLPQGQFAMGEGRVGFNLWVGTWERNSEWMLKGLVNGDYPDYAFESPSQRAMLVPLVGQPDETPFKEAALSRMKSDPGFVLSSWIIRYPKLWLGTRTEQSFLRMERGSFTWTMFKGSFYLLNSLVLALGVVGIALLVRRQEMMLVVPVVYIALVHVPFHNTETRYSLPALPFMYLFATVAMAHLFSRRSRRWGFPSRQSAASSVARSYDRDGGGDSRTDLR
jgi:hypothetical protein